MASFIGQGAARLLLVGLAVNVVVAGTAGAAITRQETVTASDEGGSTLLLPAIPGGTDQTYVLLIATRKNKDVTAVTGGGLTWLEQVEQCGGREQQGVRLWTSQGSPGPPFESCPVTQASGRSKIPRVRTRTARAATATMVTTTIHPG
jgi:hypothetical protein